MKKLNREALKSACFALAKNTLWKMGPVDVSTIQTHADRLYEEALSTELDEFIEPHKTPSCGRGQRLLALPVE